MKAARTLALLLPLFVLESTSARCDCTWAKGGCGDSDGSVCWHECCRTLLDLPAYVNHYSAKDALGAAVHIAAPQDTFAFIVADHGLPNLANGATGAWDELVYGEGAGCAGPCCQTMVADMMRSKRAELEAQGKSLAFIGTAGDTFYWVSVAPCVMPVVVADLTSA